MCGIFGVSGVPDAARLVAVGLHHLQHRGQEACGIVAYNGDQNHTAWHRGIGLVSRVFEEPILERLRGDVAIGHTRYSTAGDKSGTLEQRLRDVQPFIAFFPFGSVSIAHNGNLTNAVALKQELLAGGHMFQTSGVDTEVALKLIGVVSGNSFHERLSNALLRLEGAYSCVLLCDGNMVGVRDPHGIRPLLVGILGDGFAFSSESCALEAIGAEVIRSVRPGEILGTDAGITF